MHNHFGSTECPTCEGLSLTMFTADPVETGAKPACMVLREAQCQRQGLRHMRADSSSQLWQRVAWAK